MSLQDKVANLIELDSDSVWRLPGQKKFSYSDGVSQEEVLRGVLRKAADLGSDSRELERHITDWVTEYHLSRKRSQLLRGFAFRRSDRVLEVGCGCGAITRYLGETFDDVVAIEGSHARAEALLSMAKALGFVVETSGDGSSHKIEITSVEPQGESQAGEGAAQSPTESEAAAARASADDNANAGGNDVAGKVKGKTLDMNGVPEKLQAATTKNDGDADIGKKGTGADLPDAQSGAGAQKKDVRPPEAEDAIRRMIQALAKSVQDSNAAVTKTVEALAARVDGVAALAKKTDAALQGTVFNEEGDDRSAARAQKSVDGMGGIPLLDTGLSRRLV